MIKNLAHFQQLGITFAVVENFKAVAMLMSKKMAGDDISMLHDGGEVIFVELGIKPLLSWSSLKSTRRNMTYNEHLKNNDFPY